MLSPRIGTLASFPGSALGKTVNFFSHHLEPLNPIQYDVTDRIQSPPTAPKVNVTIQNSPDCEGVIHPTDSKVCTINNLINSQTTSQNATTLSAKSIQKGGL